MCPMCEDCDPWKLSDSCVYAKVSAALAVHSCISVCSQPFPAMNFLGRKTHEQVVIWIGVHHDHRDHVAPNGLYGWMFYFVFYWRCPLCACVFRWPICLIMAALCSLLSSWLFGVGVGSFCLSLFLILTLVLHQLCSFLLHINPSGIQIYLYRSVPALMLPLNSSKHIKLFKLSKLFSTVNSAVQIQEVFILQFICQRRNHHMVSLTECLHLHF